MAGTNDRGGDQGGVPATGRRFRCPGASIGRLRYGKIIEQRDYWNMTALTQVGLISAPQGSAEPTR